MKTVTLIIFILTHIIVFACSTNQSQTEEQDSLLLSKLFETFEDQKNLPIGDLIVEVGKTFLETPYVAHTLENGMDEELVMNLHEFDCNTFAENCLALARSIKTSKTSFQGFKSVLEQVRYRDGVRNGYCSRLHYFSEWISNNIEKGLVEIPKNLQLKPFDGQVNFMSTHPTSYEVLKGNPDLVEIIAKQEKQISQNSLSFIPKLEIAKNESFLKDGDIVGIATSIPGLDIAHVGIVVSINGRKHLMHASSSAMKVVISKKTLHDFIQQKKSYTGIIIARPVF